MSELTKTNQVQTTINPGRPMVKVEVETDSGGHHQQIVEDAPNLTEEVQSIEVTMSSSGHRSAATTPRDPLAMDEHDPVAPSVSTPIAVSIGSAVNTTRHATGSQQQVNVPQQKFQDVRVDNWGNYCLQRLQVMYDRGDFCDLTMQFHTNQLLKVHRVVVNLCTEYFANLERLFGLTDGILVLPKDIEYQAMVTIVKFFYTGKLEIRGNQFNEVYRTVKLMNITILIKLLEAHAKKPVAQAKKEPTRPIVFKQAVEIGRPLQKGQIHQGMHQMAGAGGPVFSGAVPGSGGTKTLQVTTPGVKLPPGVKTKTVLARVQSQSVRMSQQNSGRATAQKKLPIWKERKYNPASLDSFITPEKWPIKDEPARPTRFEWGDPEDDPAFGTPVISHTLMEKQKASSSNSSMRKIEDIFDAVKTQNLGKRNLMNSNSPGTSVEPPSKMSKFGSPSDKPEDPMTSSHHNDVNLTDETVEEEVSTTEVNIPQQVVKRGTSGLKPALKSQTQRLAQMVGKNDPNLGDMGKSQETATTSGSTRIHLPHPKTVRFAPEIEKENSSKNNETQVLATGTEDFASSHSKIIAEVLKKYPDLVKDKQNIKLKIIQKGAESSPSKDKSKVSYIVLKSTSSPEGMGAVLLKKPNHTVAHKSFWDGEADKKPSGAENTTGPWLCNPCGGGEETPIGFESYYEYRRHLVDVHGERIDARICEYCGQKASKRNLLLYHLYTKHGISPPKNMHFPSCDRCDYVALSESLLTKHKQTHDAAREFSCHICNASFKSSGALQGHMSANLHRNKDTKVYECPYCRKPFVRNINLKGHIRALHREIARIEEMDDPRLPHDDTLTLRGTTSMNVSNRKRQFPSILGSRTVPLEILPGGSEGQQVSLVTADGHTIEILHGLDPNTMSVPMTLVQSSEAEAMTNVASSIAASLGLGAQGVHGATEFMTGVTSDGSQAVYIMDNSQPAVEVDMSAMGLTTEGAMIYEGDDPSGQGQFIVQDIHGNQFRKMTGIDETGKPVIFFQLSEDSSQIMTPAILEDEMQISQGNSSVFVSSGMSVPVNVSSGNDSQQTQVLITASDHDGTVYEMVQNPDDESDGQVVIAPITDSNPDEVDHDQAYEDDNMEQIDQNVQELHIVLDQNANNHEVDDSQDRSQDESLLNDEQEEELSEDYVHNNGHHTTEQETIISGEHVMVVEEINSESEMPPEDQVEEAGSGDLHIHQDENTSQGESESETEVKTEEIVTSEEVQLGEELEMVEVSGESLSMVEEEIVNEQEELQS